MNFLDPQFLMYAAAAGLTVLGGYFIMAIFTDGVKAVYRQNMDEERRKRQAEREKKHK